MTGPSPLIASLLSLAAAVEARVRPAGWVRVRDEYDPDAVRWMEPGSAREVYVDEIPGEPTGRVVTATNGREWITIRAVGDTDPARVIATLDVWGVLPGGER